MFLDRKVKPSFYYFRSNSWGEAQMKEKAGRDLIHEQTTKA